MNLYKLRVLFVDIFKKQPWLCFVIFFFIITVIHMGPSFWKISSVVLDQPGDHTAGIMYNSWITRNGIFLGHSMFTNFPYGEDLWEPLSISSQIPSTLHYILSEVTNLVAGWNMLVLFGYMANAICMFGFMRWLTKNSLAAIFSAYAVTFTPYHIFASRGQIAGLLGFVFILILWKFIVLWKKPSVSGSIILGALLGINFYIDGYFILIGITMLVSMWTASLIYGYILYRHHRLRGFLEHIKNIVITSVVSICMLMPLVFVNFKYAPHIKSIFATARGSVAQDAQIYSAQLKMYLDPKSLLYLGFTVTLLAMMYLWVYRGRFIVFVKECKDIDSNIFTVILVTSMAIIAAWLSLRPRGSLLGLNIYNPSSLIIAFTASWRVFGRLYVLVAIGAATLAGLGLAELMSKFSRRRHLIAFSMLILLVAEFSIFPLSSPTQNFNFKKGPPVYYWLRERGDIKTIAEYPLDEPPQGKYLGRYYTYQQISHKPIINSLRPNSPEVGLRRSITGINDPQTIPVLRALGVGAVNIRPFSNTMRPDILRDNLKINQNLHHLFSYSSAQESIETYKINNGKVAQYALTIPSIQYFQVKVSDEGETLYMVDDNVVLSLVKLPGAVGQDTADISFNISSDSSRGATILQNGNIIWSGKLEEYQKKLELNVSTKYPITIYNQISNQLTHINISGMNVNNP